MIKVLWHEILLDYYLFFYNRCSEAEPKKRGAIIRKAFYHQDKIAHFRNAENAPN
ncbi:MULTISPECIES: hypothetical protein [Bacillaceae]|uniref:Uncharacterized protein n=1 Tax=Evansella alkalicola TaxID=745819 RepID=A0ABS6JSQ2_9BACI|nr:MULTISPECIES: hypothetical protein [Bacillaceae]MBU9721595.1 hypothetical protein [Bacillus alkalicola]